MQRRPQYQLFCVDLSLQYKESLPSPLHHGITLLSKAERFEVSYKNSQPVNIFSTDSLMN